MRKLKRLEEPDFLRNNWEEWGREWEQRRLDNSKAVFDWRTVDNEKVNLKLMPTLKTQTQSHCSFCDGYPVSPPSVDTIEHLKPKAEFPREAYLWPNLFYCCCWCQRKKGKFSEDILKPDAPDYSFSRYFQWDFTLGTIEANSQATPEDQKRARATILYFRLNEGHPSLRKREAVRRNALKADLLDDFCYRNYLEGEE